jgi:hypothetical protein
VTPPKPWYATNARNLLETRRQGLIPEGPVNVAMAGGEFGGGALYLRPEMPADRLDWRMLVNLDVWVWANPQASLEWVTDTVWRIAKVRPNSLCLRFEHDGHTHDIDCGTGIHHPKVQDIAAVHEFWWLPINTGGTPIGYRILRALTAEYPKRIVL